MKAPVVLASLIAFATSAAAGDVGRFFPVSGDFAANIYARTALARVDKLLAGPPPRESATPAELAPRFTGIRDFAEETQLLVWAYVHPSSPHRADPAVAERIRKRFGAMARFVRGGSFFEVFPPVVDNHYNVFFHESFAFSLLALRTLSPDFFPPDEAARWEQLVREGLAFQMQDSRGHEKDGEYGIIPNIDMRYANFLVLSAELLGDPALRKKADELVEVVGRHLLPDGAFNYMAGENESFSYHESVIRDLARFHFLTGSPRASELIVRSKAYYPLSMEPGGVAEYASAPNWKAFWNGTGMLAGPEIVAHFSADPVNRGIAREQARLNPAMETVYPADLLIAAACYDPSAPTAPQADNGMFSDANIGGFRGRFGRFSFLAGARDLRKTIPPIASENPARDFTGSHQGRATYVGAVVTDGPTRLQPLNAALLRVYSNVQIEADKPLWQGSAYLSHNSTETTSLTGDAGALSARYELASAAFGPRLVPRAGWVGSEAWVFEKNRMAGVVAVEATEDTSVESLSGRIALGFGRTGPGLQPKTLENLGGGMSAYGDLRVRVVAHNYEKIEIDPAAPYFRDAARTATEIVLTSRGDGARLACPKGTRRFFVVEVFPAWATPAKVEFRMTPEGLGVLEIDGGRRTLVFNPGGASLPVPDSSNGATPILAPGAHVLHAR